VDKTDILIVIAISLVLVLGSYSAWMIYKEPEPEPEYPQRTPMWWGDVYVCSDILHSGYGLDPSINYTKIIPHNGGATARFGAENNTITLWGTSYFVMDGDYTLSVSVGNYTSITNISLNGQDVELFIMPDQGNMREGDTYTRLYDTPSYNGTITDKWETVVNGDTIYRVEIDNRSLISVMEWDYHNMIAGEVIEYRPYDVVGNVGGE